MLWILLLSLLLLSLAGLFLARMEFHINTYQNHYELRWGPLLQAKVDTTEELPALAVRLGPFRKKWRLSDLQSKTLKTDKPKKTGKKPKKSKAFPLQLIIDILRSFRVRQFKLQIDTDDYVWNAWLFTPVYLIPGLRRHISINFMGRNGLVLQIENQLWRLGLAALRHLPIKPNFLTKSYPS